MDHHVRGADSIIPHTNLFDSVSLFRYVECDVFVFLLISRSRDLAIPRGSPNPVFFASPYSGRTACLRLQGKNKGGGMTEKPNDPHKEK